MSNDTILDLLGNDLSDLVTLDDRRVVCNECGRSELTSHGSKIRHAGWCESCPRVETVVAGGELLCGFLPEEPAKKEVELVAVSAHVRKGGNRLYDENDVVAAVRGGFLSVSDAMNRDY